jgi:hypothetical protein
MGVHVRKNIILLAKYENLVKLTWKTEVACLLFNEAVHTETTYQDDVLEVIPQDINKKLQEPNPGSSRKTKFPIHFAGSKIY